MIHTIENEYLKISVAELGATLTKFIDKRSNTDIVLGYEDEDSYRQYAGNNMGISCGRNCNRIGNARFTLNGQEYQLTVNDNMNQLHGGGINGFGFKTWKLEEKSDNELVFSYLSKDGEEGFPGNLDARVSFRLEGDSLIYTFSGTSDKDTIFNMTNHSYFNLGDESILDEELMITTDTYSPNDEYCLAKPVTEIVNGTYYDFREYRKLGDSLPNLDTAIDNNYVWEKMEDKLMASLRNDKLVLNIYSDLPDMHLYTSYYLEGGIGKYGKRYDRYKGCCLECQYYPNAINYEGYLKPILRKGETMSHYMRMEVKER